MNDAQQQTRPATPQEDIRVLYSRVATLNDQVAALLNPDWGTSAGILPEGHPLRDATKPDTPPADALRRRVLAALGETADMTWDQIIATVAATARQATTAALTPAAMLRDELAEARAAVERARAEGAIEALRTAAEHARLGVAIGPLPLEFRPAVDAWLCRLAEHRLAEARRKAADILTETGDTQR